MSSLARYREFLIPILAHSRPTFPPPPSPYLRPYPLPSPWPALLPHLPLHDCYHHHQNCHPNPIVGSTFAPTKLCMGDPDVDHGFYYDEQGRIDILHSPFFDVSFSHDPTTDEYVERIIYQLTLAIEDQIPAGRWYLVSRRPTSPNSATSPATSTQGLLFFLVASLVVAYILSIPTPSLKECNNPKNALETQWRTPTLGHPPHHVFYYDEQRRVDILHSPFFDVSFGHDPTADESVERIIYQLTLAIEDQIPAGRWYLVSRRPTSPNSATSPATSTQGLLFFLVASLVLAYILLRPYT
ncbi:hypothetical protein M5K25_017667 [Dendrobium thyrsiflorum]|uniref:Uncharacterized protein n=1 Tax=Dendrobium thyrsiflorum TaxID=117978 RepID=A0ABD0UVJ7_DENTH